MSAASVPRASAVPPAATDPSVPGELGPPCRVPARTVRVGVVPRPRLRPLHEVLATTPPPTPTGAAAATPQHQDGIDALAEAARPAAVSLFGVLAEILDGRRPVRHLEPLCVDGLYARASAVLTGDQPSPRRPSEQAVSRVSGVRVCAVGPAAAEVSAVLHRDGRARALAARLERSERRWWLTALVVG